MNRLVEAGNTLVPSVLALEQLGYEVRIEASGSCRAVRGDEEYLARDPATVLGLIKLVEVRGWDWRAADADIEAVARRYGLF
ncbi:MAG TPA: hypothetical protein VFF12_11745 [Myxococcaceae bacterium]|nr:hypothetical protein [Myxococcaceae bacterium]